VKKYFNQILSNIRLDLNLNELIRGTALVFIFRLLGVFSGYMLSYIITKYFGDEVLGIYSICFTLLSLAVVFSRMGLDEALVKVVSQLNFQNKSGQARAAYLNSSVLVFFLSLLVAIIFYESSHFFAQWFGNILLEEPIKIVAFAIVPFALIKLNAEMLRGMKKLKAYSYLQTGSLFLVMCLFIVAGIPFFKFKIDIPFYALLFSCFIICLLSYFLVQKHSRVAIKSQESLGRLLKISLPMMLTSSMFLVLSWTDNILLGRFLSEDQVGIYFVAFKLALIISLSLFAVNSAVAPKFSELSSINEGSSLRRLARQSVKLNLATSLPIFIALILSTEYLLSLYGNSFLLAKRCVYILAVGQLYNSLSGSVLNFLNMTGFEKLVSKIIFSAALLNIVLNYFLIPQFDQTEGWTGIEGAAIASTISVIYWNSLGLYFVYKHHGIFMFPHRLLFKKSK
tara:strand:+ start:4744 stop:6102 length:1359 start_codon:yes stop_codon:yes gene_type:complete